jgi:hypothetical protein
MGKENLLYAFWRPSYANSLRNILPTIIKLQIYINVAFAIAYMWLSLVFACATEFENYKVKILPQLQTFSKLQILPHYLLSFKKVRILAFFLLDTFTLSTY